jgi:hypothetical protein
MSNKTYDIKSYEDLQAVRKNLRFSIQEQELSFKNNPIVKIADSIKNKESIKSTLFENLPEIKFETGEKLISSFLLGNKVTRNYFAIYLVAKEMIPYIFEKIKGIVSSNEESIES